MNILFDSMGAQVQVNNDGKKPDNQRLATWLAALKTAGYNVSFTNYNNTITSQLGNNQLLITTTRQWTGPNHSPIPAGTDFGYVWSDSNGTLNDLGGIQNFVYNGNSLLLFVNHSVPLGSGPFWPVNDIQLAASLGITINFAEFASSTGDLTMTPNASAPSAIIQGVSSVQAWDSGGISPAASPNVTSTILVPLPPSNCSDKSGLGYNPANYAFSVLYTFGKGNVIVIGHSGIVGTDGTPYPSQGQIGSANNQQFLMNCVAYLVNAALAS